MPTLNLTDDELEAVFLLCSEECEVAYHQPDVNRGLLHLGIQHKCFRAMQGASFNPPPAELPKWKIEGVA